MIIAFLSTAKQHCRAKRPEGNDQINSFNGVIDSDNDYI